MDVRFTATLKILVTLGAIILAAVVLIGFIDFVRHIALVATIVVGAIFLAYIIYPAVRRLNQRLPLWFSILIVYAIVIALLGLALAFIVPALADNLRQLIHDAPALVRNLQVQIGNPNNTFFAHVPPQVKQYLEQLPTQLVSLLERYGGEAATRAVSVVVSAASILALFVVIPVVAIYILLDLDAMCKSTLEAVPIAARPRVAKIAMECNAAIGGFIRGQLLVAAIVGVLVIALLEGLHVRYAILIGVFAGVVEIVPYVGAFAGGIVAVFTALVTNGWQNAAIVLAGFVIVNQLEGHVIYPFVVSGSVGLSPLLVVLALLAGGELWGFPGLVIAVPVAALIKVLLANLVPQQEPLEWEPTLRRAARLGPPPAIGKLIEKARRRRD